ncbi:MAG: AAA family ATPase [Massilia sp.]
MLSTLKQADIEAELHDGAAVKPHYVTQDREYPLTLLSDRQFELLAHELVIGQVAAQSFYDSARVLPYGADEGRDVVLYAGETPVGVIQCKRYASTIGVPLILRELFKFLLFALRNPHFMPDPDTFRYELWTARDLTKEAGEFFKEPQRYFALNAGELARFVADARKGTKELKTLMPGKTKDDEAREVIAIVKRLQFDHHGASSISRCLSEQPLVRRWFFRSPDDVGVRPGVAEVDRLVQQFSGRALGELQRSGHLANPSYVAPVDLLAEFAQFLDSGKQVFVLTGGTGHGKTAWAAHLLESAPTDRPVLMIRGEDLSASDMHIVETIARLLKAHPIPAGLSGADMTAAVWDWFDCANRLLLIDGLDRAPVAARESLPNWINHTVQAMNGKPLRLALISRNEEWTMLNSSLDIRAPWHRQLGMLSLNAARAMYAAYGLPSSILQKRPLRTPGLIRLFSELKEKLGGHVTRARLLAHSVHELQLKLDHKFGKSQVRAAFAELSRALVAAADVVIGGDDFRNCTPATMQVIDELHRCDILISVGEGLRPASDDIAEYLLGLRLDWRNALDEVAKGRHDPVFFGAIAMSPHLRESRGELEALIEAVLPKIQGGISKWFELAVRIMIEVDDHTAHVPNLCRIFDAWNRNNVVLPASNLSELLDDLRLPLAEQFDLLMRLANGEDRYDWKWKYWLHHNERGRIVTRWAEVVCRMVRTNPDECLPLLERLAVEKTSAARHWVAQALMLEAAAVALPQTFDCCRRMGDHGRDVWYSLALAYPRGFALYALDQVRADPQLIDEFADLLWQSFSYADGGRLPTSGERLQLQLVVEQLLSFEAGRGARSQLLLCSLLCSDCKPHRLELIGALRVLKASEIWWLVKLSEPDAENLLRNIFSDMRAGHLPFDTLGAIHPSFVPAAQWPLLSELIRSLATVRSTEARKAVAEGLELILYELDCEPEPVLALFAPLAQEIASDKDARVRTYLIYYAACERTASPSMPPHVHAFRDNLIALLVEAEDGATLSILLEKLEYRPVKDPFAEAMVARLEQRFGPFDPDRFRFDFD